MGSLLVMGGGGYMMDVKDDNKVHVCQKMFIIINVVIIVFFITVNVILIITFFRFHIPIIIFYIINQLHQNPMFPNKTSCEVKHHRVLPEILIIPITLRGNHSYFHSINQLLLL